MADRTHFEFDGFQAINDSMKRAMSDSKSLQEFVRKATWEVLADVRRAVVNNAKFKNSKHNSIASVRRSVYKKIMGGAVGILDGKRKANSGSFAKTGQSERTQQINAYSGEQRGFILRFVNSGTEDRYVGGRNYTKKMKAYIEKNSHGAGFRGHIKPMNFFSPAANGSIQEAAKNLAEMIENEIANQLRS